MHGTLIRGIDAEGHSVGPEVDLDYSPLVFNQQNMDAAKHIILTPTPNVTVAERWTHETEFMLQYLDQLKLTRDSWVLDYGCGIGRLSKVMIEHYGCRVVGVDISKSMRGLAHTYVQSDRFISCSAEVCDDLAPDFDAAIAVWTLQHCKKPTEDIQFIWRNLSPDGKLLVLNEHFRYVPVVNGRSFDWVDDHQEVWGVLSHLFSQVWEQPFPSSQARLAFYQRQDQAEE